MADLMLMQKYFGTCDVYKVFDVPRDAEFAVIKKAYYKLSLQIHPDRVPLPEKQYATEKFKILANLYQMLMDQNQRAEYDKYGSGDYGMTTSNRREDIGKSFTMWLEMWRRIYKPPCGDESLKAIIQKQYFNSAQERSDIKDAYLAGTGCMNFLICTVPFLCDEDEERVHRIIREMIVTGEVPEYGIFANEKLEHIGFS